MEPGGVYCLFLPPFPTLRPQQKPWAITSERTGDGRGLDPENGHLRPGQG